jgi:hypothetical protein
MWLIEMFFALPLTFFIAKIIDIRGAFGVPGTGGSLDGVFWGALVVSLICGFFFHQEPRPTARQTRPVDSDGQRRHRRRDGLRR